MKETKLSSVIEVISMGPFGSDIKVDNFISEGIPVLNGSNLTSHKLVENSFKYVSLEKANKLGKANAFRGDIVITHRGTLGQVAYIPYNSKYERYVISQSQFRVRFNGDLDPVYFSYLMKSDYGQKKLLSFKSHVGVPALAQATSNFKRLELKLHNIIDQKKIATVLSDLDDKIELNNQINKELEAMAKTLYDYWFVQFDFPFDFAHGHFDSAQGKTNEHGTVAERSRGYKSSGGKMVFDQTLKREIPAGWEVKRLESCIDKIIDYRGRTPKKLESDWSENMNDIIALSAKHVKGGKLVNLNAANRVDDKLYQKWMKEKLQEGDIIMTSEAPCGEFFYLVGETKYCLSQRVFAIRANSEVINHACLYYELSSGNGYSQIMGKVSGSTVFGIRQDELRTVNVLIPGEKSQNDFQEKIIPVYQKIRINEKQNQELAQLRDWLLPMLMNGQVRVGESDEEVLGLVADEKSAY